MKSQRNSSKWNLRDVVDFEALAERADLWRGAWRDGVRELVEAAKPKSEKARRRLGFKLMLDAIREKEGAASGERVENGFRALELALRLVMLLVGVAVIRGLLVDFDYTYEGGEARKFLGFNIWVFLGVTLGLQWLMMLGALFSYVLWRRKSGSVSLLQIPFQWVLKKIGGESIRPQSWGRLLRSAHGSKSVFGWRLAKLLHAGGGGYNVGLLLGLFGCLWFLQIGFYWESTLSQFGKDSLLSVTRFLSLGLPELTPTEQWVDEVRRGAVLKELSGSVVPVRSSMSVNWGKFFIVVIAVWGLLPRVLLWLYSCWKEQRAFAGLDFQESHHRTLWRDVTRVQRGEISSAPADGVVVLDVGGLEIETESLRPFFLQTLRVNPEGRFTLGTLDENEEHEALEAAKAAAMGVVLLVEGWNLSPKQMQSYHEKVRTAVGEGHLLRYVVIGSDEELRQWEAFVDSLKDSETEVFQYTIS